MKTFVFGLFALAGLFVAAPAMAQTYNPSYYYPQYTQPQYTTPYYGTGTSYGCPNISYNLVLGSSDYTTGGQVTQLQNFLRTRYNDQRLTGGYYGQLTSYYVTRFQQENSVYPATGGVGPLTRQAIQRVCGGGYNPGYPTNPINRTTTFRLDRDFTLEVSETGKLRNEDLTITLNQIVTSQYGYGYYYNQEPQAVRITVTEGCSAGVYCIYAPSQSYLLEDGDDVNFRDWNIEVKELDRDEATFRVTERDNDDDDNDEDGTIDVTSPSTNIEVEQGDDLDIEWNVTDEPNNASVVLELYDEDDDRVGTIAIVEADEEEYEWDVPEKGDICTLQYPNGLCGFDLDGEYYIKATLVEGNNGTGDELDEDKSHIFTIED